jgi:hypothetical protein
VELPAQPLEELGPMQAARLLHQSRTKFSGGMRKAHDRQINMEYLEYIEINGVHRDHERYERICYWWSLIQDLPRSCWGRFLVHIRMKGSRAKIPTLP